MLARGNRITRGADYKAVVRGGRRCASANAVTYIVTTGEQRPSRFGFIVSKQVGGAVVRNTVRRRFKAASAQLLQDMNVGTDIVVRALPASAHAPFHQLRADLLKCVRRAERS